MTSNNLPLIRRVIGFSLMILGVTLFAVLIPIAAQAQNMVMGFAFVLIIVSCIALGSFLFLRVGFWNAVKSLLIVLILSVPWFAIFLIPISSDIQLLLAVFVALIAVLLYRRYYSKHGSLAKSSGER
jgi:hypothetical protein